MTSEIPENDAVQQESPTQPEFHWLVDEFLMRGQLTLLAAREKSGKSLLGIDLAASVALGEPFLGRTIVTPGPTVYCPAEDHLSDVRRRVRERLRGSPAGMGAGPRVIPLDGSVEGNSLRLENPADLAKLRATIEEHGATLVVLDPLREFHAAREDTSDEMAPLLKGLRDITRQTRAGIVLMHHMGKSGVPRGSTAITGSVDEIWEYDGEQVTPGERAA